MKWSVRDLAAALLHRHGGHGERGKGSPPPPEPPPCPVVHEEYRLRNEPELRFAIVASGRGSGAGGSVVRARITDPQGRDFRYEVVFEGGYAAARPDFDAAMFLLTGISVVQAQIESYEHQDTRIRISRPSGLMETEPGATLDWTAVE